MIRIARKKGLKQMTKRTKLWVDPFPLVADLGGSGRIHKYQIDVNNMSGWTSGTRIPGWAQTMRSFVLGIDGTSLFYNHPRGGARYKPSTGGNLDQHYSFVTAESSCAECVLP